MEHARRIEQAFTAQADAFEDVGWGGGRVGRHSGDALRADVGGDTVTGFQPRARDDGALWFVQTFASAIATKPR